MNIEIKHPVLLDAQQRHREYPRTFSVPDKMVLQTLSRGDYAQVCADRERFWVLITEVVKTGFQGVIENDLICTSAHHLADGDRIFFEAQNILKTQ